MNKVPRRNFMKTAVGLAAGLVFSGFSAVVSAEEANPRTKMTEEEKRLVQIIIKTCVKPDDLKFLIEGIKILEFFRNMGKRIFVPKELRESFFNLKGSVTTNG